MKCDCFVKTIVSPKGRVTRKECVSWWHTTDLGIGSAKVCKSSEELLADGYDICEGTINVEIAAVDEPYYGGTSATLEVNYRCSICDNSFYPELPNSSNINEFLSGLLENINGHNLRQNAKQKEIEESLARERMLAEYKVRVALEQKERAERKRIRQEKKLKGT